MPARNFYVLGLDLGQVADASALALIEFNYMQEPCYRVRALHRFKLGTPYTALPAAIGVRLQEPPLLNHVAVAVDATGVGAPMIEHFRTELGQIKLYGITITGGSAVGGTHRSPNVPKHDLIATTSVILEQRRLQIAENMRETERLTEELLAFRRTITEHGNDTYAAQSGSHDDLVLALSLALWTAEHRRVAHSNLPTSSVPQGTIPGVDEFLASRRKDGVGYPF